MYGMLMIEVYLWIFGLF